MAGGGDRLSGLSDDLLRHVLSFAPAKEAACTCALSRRWRPLWRSSDAVNLDSRSFRGDLRAFQRAAEPALSSHDRPVRSLALHIERPVDAVPGLETALGRTVADVLAGPAARGVEELRVRAVQSGRGLYNDEQVSANVGIYELSLAALPPATLRVLHVANCMNLACATASPSLPPCPWCSSAPARVKLRCRLRCWDTGAAVAFPRLAELRLHACSVQIKGLQGAIDAAPLLATLDLRSVFFAGTHVDHDHDQDQRHHDPPPSSVSLRLRCPAATAVVLAHCFWENHWRTGMEINAPRLRRFRYEGRAREFSLKSPAPDLARADLHFVDNGCRRDNVSVLLWKFLGNFSNAKVLKLRVDYLDHIAFGSGGDGSGEKRNDDELLGTLGNVERLELEEEGFHKPESETAAMAIANLLHCCPAVRDLRIKLMSTVQEDLSRKDQLGFDESVDRFLRRRRSKPVNSQEQDDEDDGDKCTTPGLSGQSFKCLQNCLTRVSLQFRCDKPSCFGARLVRFFAENAMVLEEMYIDDGDRKLHKHINHTVGGRTANSSRSYLKRKNFTGISQEFDENRYNPSKIPRLPSLDSAHGLGRRNLPSTRGFTVFCPLKDETRRVAVSTSTLKASMSCVLPIER